MSFWGPYRQRTNSSFKSMASEKFQKTLYKNIKCYDQYAAKSFLLETQWFLQYKVILKNTTSS